MLFNTGLANALAPDSVSENTNVELTKISIHTPFLKRNEFTLLLLAGNTLLVRSTQPTDRIRNESVGMMGIG
jgi:hypothetical protein